MINDIIEKRTQLMNFFKNEVKTYSKEEILNKEFAVLSFSPTEEYIDVLESPFDDKCVDLSTFDFDDCDEVYLKGIITDIDKKNGYTIFHIQNKDALASITASGATLEKYDEYIVNGEPIVAKCSIYNGRPSLSFLINLNNIDVFKKECSYFKGESFKKVDEVMDGRKGEHVHYGVIVHCRFTKSSKDKDMVIGSLYDGEKIRGFATVKTFYNRKIPYFATAGDFVAFTKPKPTMEFVLSGMEVVKL